MDIKVLIGWISSEVRTIEVLECLECWSSSEIAAVEVFNFLKIVFWYILDIEFKTNQTKQKLLKEIILMGINFLICWIRNEVIAVHVFRFLELHVEFLSKVAVVKVFNFLEILF